MYKSDASNYLESSSLSKVIYNATGSARTPKWHDKSDEIGKIFELETRELFLKLGAKVINTNKCLLDLSETKSPQRKYDVDCLAIIEKKGLKDNQHGFVLICECKTTKSEKMRANHGFFNKIKAQKTFINQRLRKILKGKYIPIYVLATEGFNYSPELKKKYLDEQVILMSEVEAKYLSDCYDVSKNQDFTFNQFLSFFRSSSWFYDNLCVGAFETFTDFTKKKTAYTFSAKAKQMIQLTGVAHKVAKDLISDEEGKILNTDHYQRILKKGRLSNIGKYLDREKKPFNNNLLLSYRGKNKDFDFKFLSSVGEGRTGELVVKGKPGSFHVIDGQHRLFGYMAASDERVLDQTLIVTVFKDLTQAEEAQIFLDVNSNQKKVDIALRREVQLILGDSASGADQVDNLATLIVLGLREDPNSPFNKNPVAIPLPESGGIIPVEQLRKAILNGGLIARSKDFRKGQLNVDDNFNKTYEFSLRLFINYFQSIRKAVESNGDCWKRSSKENKSVALRTNFICGCILLLERMIEEASRGKVLKPNEIESAIEKYVKELLQNIKTMTERQKILLFAWNKNGVDMEEGSGKFPSSRAHLIDELLPSFKELLYKNEEELYINIRTETNLDHVKDLMRNWDPDDLGKQAMAYEQIFFRRLHKFLCILFGEDYWQDIIENYLLHVAKSILEKKSAEAKSEWRGLSPDINDIQYKNPIDWAEWTQVREIFTGLFKDSNGQLQSKLKCHQNINLKNLIVEVFLTKLKESDADPQGIKGLEWTSMLASLRNVKAHPRDSSEYTQKQKDAYDYVKPELFNILEKMDLFMDKELDIENSN